MDLDELRAKHRTVTVLEHEGRVAAFRGMTVDEAREVSDQLKAAPDLAYPLAIKACLQCLIGGETAFAEILEAAPLAVDFDEGLAGRLLEAASDVAKASVAEALRKFRHSDRNLGQMADNLLAFKAYAGGAPSSGAQAGALHIAEAIDALKATLKLQLAVAKAYCK